MKLTTEQEALLAVLVAVEAYEVEDEDYEELGLLNKIGELGMEENGFYLERKVDDFKALADNGLIEFDFENSEYSPDGVVIEGIELLEAGRDYVKHMDESEFSKMMREAGQAIKAFMDSVEVTADFKVGPFKFNRVMKEKKEK